jgi:hypothetical protein
MKQDNQITIYETEDGKAVIEESSVVQIRNSRMDCAYLIPINGVLSTPYK